MATQQNNGQVEEKLDYVRRGEPITADAWNKLVARANKPLDVSIVRTRRAKSSDGVEIRLAQLTTRLVWDSTAKIYKATARFYDNGRPDTSGYTFELYAPAVTQSATASRFTRYNRVWIIARNDRWELLEIDDPYIPTYGSGSYCEIVTDLSNTYTYVLNNTGTTVVKVAGYTSYTNTKDLYFSPTYFQWVQSTLDIVGKRDLSLKTKQVTVVTGIVNGTPTTETITVLDPS